MLCYPNIASDEHPSFDEAPRFCPTKLKKDVVDESIREYMKDDVREFARLASVQEFQCYERTPFESLEISYKNLKAMGLS